MAQPPVPPDVAQVWLVNGVKYTCDAPTVDDEPSTTIPLEPPAAFTDDTGAAVAMANPAAATLKPTTHPVPVVQFVGFVVPVLCMLVNMKSCVASMKFSVIPEHGVVTFVITGLAAGALRTPAVTVI